MPLDFPVIGRFLTAKPITFLATLRILVALWLSLWILWLPLFHIHIQTETQRGISHTVFSPDLPGEYSPFKTDSVGRQQDAQQRTGHAAHLRSGSSYSELAFTTPVPQKNKPHTQRQHAIVEGRIPLHDADSSWSFLVHHSDQYRNSLVIIASSSRAPPATSLPLLLS